jgi:hypothetical protein
MYVARIAVQYANTPGNPASNMHAYLLIAGVDANDLNNVALGTMLDCTNLQATKILKSAVLRGFGPSTSCSDLVTPRNALYLETKGKRFARI